MSYFVRFFDFEQGTEMFFSEASYGTWLGRNKAPAAAIGAIPGKYITKSELSVFETDGSESSIERIIVAMEAKDANLLTRSSKKRIYALLPKDKIESAGIEVDITPGDTADNEVNSWHRNLIHLDMKKLSKILDLVHRNDAIWEVCQPEKYCKLVKAYSDDGKLVIQKVHANYVKALGLSV